MSAKPVIRMSESADHYSIESLYPSAFPDEDLLPLVRDLLHEAGTVISLIAMIDSRLAGHVIFSRCGVTGSRVKAALLAPLAVAPASQQRGIGSALIREGVDRLKKQGTDIICVLGDPAFYERFGFVPERFIKPPYQLPAEWLGAWQSLTLSEKATGRAGILSVPAPWRKPALWAP